MFEKIEGLAVIQNETRSTSTIVSVVLGVFGWHVLVVARRVRLEFDLLYQHTMTTFIVSVVNW
jgi:hypothetical protein